MLQMLSSSPMSVRSDSPNWSARPSKEASSEVLAIHSLTLAWIRAFAFSSRECCPVHPPMGPVLFSLATDNLLWCNGRTERPQGSKYSTIQIWKNLLIFTNLEYFCTIIIIIIIIIYVLNLVELKKLTLKSAKSCRTKKADSKNC